MILIQVVKVVLCHYILRGVQVICQAALEEVIHGPIQCGEGAIPEQSGDEAAVELA